MTKHEKELLTANYFHTIRLACSYHGTGDIETARQIVYAVSYPMFLVEGEDFKMWDNKVLREAIESTGITTVDEFVRDVKGEEC